MVLSIERFSGKVAVVTGASVGIGASIVEELVKSGIIVAGLARRTENVEKIAQKLTGQKGKLYAFKCDMTVEAEVIATIKQVIAKLGPVSILINNAGLSLSTSLLGGDAEKWKTVLDTNILGLCIATREVAQNMIANKTAGHIIHINSVLGHQVIDFPGFNVYGPSKYAVTALAETLRLEVNREKLQIKVTSISPGYVKTDFQSVSGVGDLPVPPLHPTDIADAVIYALSTPPHVNVSELTVRAVGS
uniref:Farnesol dehydrogenase-like n=1 Tax=Dendroctonus ponderosae TaxID=77166 RepID=A0AAR5PCU5_DENPD